MFKMITDPVADAIYIQLQDRPIAYTKELDDERVIDYAYDDTPVGIDLLAVSQGVDLNDLPEREKVSKALEGV